MRAIDETFSVEELTSSGIVRFQKIIYGHYSRFKRFLPWRETHDPYSILVSEIMLQQTQVGRVAQKYGRFLETYPDFDALARAPLRDVLGQWQGLGYNRRAVALHRTAQRIMAEFNGRLPDTEESLITLPGVGKATAGAIIAFVFERPTVFIETNIRRVYIHFFFPNTTGVKDSEIIPLVRLSLDRSRVRDWYYALMDYRAMLKTDEGNPNRRSASHSKQGPFNNSDRQIRGQILRILLSTETIQETVLSDVLGKNRERVKKLTSQLVKEGFLKKDGDTLYISDE